MLFKGEKREPLKIKAKPGVVELAGLLHEAAYPFADEANLDNLFEELVVRKALELGLIGSPEAKAAPAGVEEEIIEGEPEEEENAGTLEIGNLLGT